jgi:hypothetical protein
MGLGDNEEYQKVTATVITDASTTTAIQVARFNRLALEIPTFSLGVATISASVAVLVAYNSGDTFRNMYALTINSAGSGLVKWEVPLTKGGYNVTCREATNYNWAKIEITGTNATGTAGLECIFHLKR